MVRSLYVSIVLALALVAGQSEAAATRTNSMARRQDLGVAQGYNGSSGYTASSSFQSESHYEKVSTSFGGLLRQIRSSQYSFHQYTHTEETAVLQIQQVAAYFEYAFRQFHACDSCTHKHRIGNFQRTFWELFSSFHALVESCEERFPDKWHLLFQKSFYSLQEQFDKFFGTCQRSGLEINTFVPKQIGTFFAKTSMTSTVTTMQQSGFSF